MGEGDFFIVNTLNKYSIHLINITSCKGVDILSVLLLLVDVKLWSYLTLLPSPSIHAAEVMKMQVTHKAGHMSL